MKKIIINLCAVTLFTCAIVAHSATLKNTNSYINANNPLQLLYPMGFKGCIPKGGDCHWDWDCCIAGCGDHICDYGT